MTLENLRVKYGDDFLYAARARILACPHLMEQHAIAYELFGRSALEVLHTLLYDNDLRNREHE